MFGNLKLRLPFHKGFIFCWNINCRGGKKDLLDNAFLLLLVNASIYMVVVPVPGTGSPSSKKSPFSA